jgi:hypothetical protein
VVQQRAGGARGDGLVCVPRAVGHEAQVQWLFGWWERIDSWITENRPGTVPVPAGA